VVNIETISALVKIKSVMPKMSKSEARVCNYILKYPEEVIHLSVSELALKSGVSTATVIRACQKMGNNSYQGLKISLAQDIANPLQAINEDIMQDDSSADVMEKVFKNVLHTLEFTYRIQDAKLFDDAVDMLLHAKKICVCGLGNSRAIASDIQHKFLRLGLNASAYDDVHLQVIASCFLQEGDVLFAVSHSGSSRDIVNLAEYATKKRVKVISLTNAGPSPLADISDIALHTASNETMYRRVALSSRIAQMALVDVLYTMIALKKSDSTDGFYKIENALAYTKY